MLISSSNQKAAERHEKHHTLLKTHFLCLWHTMMSSAGSQADTSQVDQTLAVQGGRPPFDIRKSEFQNVGAALLWSMSVDKGQDLLNPAYQEAVTGPKLRTVSAPEAGIDPRALAAQFLARQQQQQHHLGIPPVNPIMPAPGLAQQVLQQQMLLAQLQQSGYR